MIKYDKGKYFNIIQFPDYNLNYWAVPKCGCTAMKAALVKQKIFDDVATDYYYVHHHLNLTYIIVIIFIGLKAKDKIKFTGFFLF